MTISAASDPALGIALVSFGAEIDQGRAPMKRLTSLGVVALAAAAVALGGVASPVAAKKVCSDSSGGNHTMNPPNGFGRNTGAQGVKNPTPPQAGAPADAGAGLGGRPPRNQEQ